MLNRDLIKIIIVICKLYWWALCLPYWGYRGIRRLLGAWTLFTRDSLTCSGCGITVSLVGRWQCGVCNFTFDGFGFAPCPVCKSTPPYLNCPRCTSGIRNPIG